MFRDYALHPRPYALGQIDYSLEVQTLTGTIELDVKDLDFYYNSDIHALRAISLPIYKNNVTALIGPSGCGKTTLLRCFNRMHDLYPNHRYGGEIIFQGENILADHLDLINLRSRIGMVFQKPTPFPMSIAENIAYGLRLKGIRNKSELLGRIEQALKHAALWDEVRDKLNSGAYELSGGQQQRLVIARALAVSPEVLLFDEPTSALDPISTAKIEELVVNLKKDVSIIIVTHNMQQAARVSDMTGFLYMGELIEYGTTEKIFTNPDKKQTDDYITGRFG